MADAEMTNSTLPPQCGHFFRCGPKTFSIFSVLRPHFKHLYSYRGTNSPCWLRVAKYSTHLEWPRPSRSVLDSRYEREARAQRFFHDGSYNFRRIERMPLPCGNPDRKSGRHHAAGVAHSARGGPDRLRRYAAHAKASEPLRHCEDA